MSGNIFDGCIAKDVGLECNCKYCSAIKRPSAEPFPEGFPEWMKDYRLLKALELQETVAKNSKRLDQAEKLAAKVDESQAVAVPRLNSLDADTQTNIKPKVDELDVKIKTLEQSTSTLNNKAQSLDTSVTTINQQNTATDTRITALETRIVALEKKVK